MSSFLGPLHQTGITQLWLTKYEQRLNNRQSEIEEREEQLQELEATVENLEKQKLNAERDAKAAEKRAADAQILEEVASQSADQAKLREREAGERTPEVLTPNWIDDIPAPLRKAIDDIARDSDYLPLEDMPDPDEKIQSTPSFLRGYLQDLAAEIYQKTAKTITDLRRRLKAALGREKDPKQDLQVLKSENVDLRMQNDILKKDIAEHTKSKDSGDDAEPIQ